MIINKQLSPAQKYTCTAVQGLHGHIPCMLVGTICSGMPRMWTDFGKNLAIWFIEYH